MCGGYVPTFAGTTWTDHIMRLGFGVAIFGNVASGAIGCAYLGSGTEPVTSCDE